MVFQIYFKQMASSEALKSYAEQKLGERLDKYNLGMTEAHVTFSMESGVSRTNCHIGTGRGVDITVESQNAQSMYAAVDLLADKLDARIRRQKEKLRSHRPRTSIDAIPAMPVASATKSEAEIDAAEIIAFERSRMASRQFS